MAVPSASTFTGSSWLRSLQEMEIINISMKIFRQVAQRNGRQRNRSRNTEIWRLHCADGPPVKLFLSSCVRKCFIMKLL